MLLAKNQLSAGLPDIQTTPDTRGVTLARAGVRNVLFPLSVVATHPVQLNSTWSLSVGLAKETRGANMSRFIGFLNDISEQPVKGFDSSTWLKELAQRLESETAYFEVAFKHFINRPAPVTGLSAPMAYDVELAASLDKELKQTVKTKIPVGNLCPCSKAISKHGAHAQRAEISLELNVSPGLLVTLDWIENIISLVQEQSSCAVYPYLKRIDEKWVTEQQYENPKFVEDIARDVHLALSEFSDIDSFSVRVEALESIHAHNAWAQSES